MIHLHSFEGVAGPAQPLPPGCERVGHSEATRFFDVGPASKAGVLSDEEVARITRAMAPLSGDQSIHLHVATPRALARTKLRNMPSQPHRDHYRYHTEAGMADRLALAARNGKVPWKVTATTALNRECLSMRLMKDGQGAFWVTMKAKRTRSRASESPFVRCDGLGPLAAFLEWVATEVPPRKPLPVRGLLESTGAVPPPGCVHVSGSEFLRAESRHAAIDVMTHSELQPILAAMAAGCLSSSVAVSVVGQERGLAFGAFPMETHMVVVSRQSDLTPESLGELFGGKYAWRLHATQDVGRRPASQRHRRIPYEGPETALFQREIKVTFAELFGKVGTVCELTVFKDLDDYFWLGAGVLTPARIIEFSHHRCDGLAALLALLGQLAAG